MPDQNDPLAGLNIPPPPPSTPKVPTNTAIPPNYTPTWATPDHPPTLSSPGSDHYPTGFGPVTQFGTLPNPNPYNLDVEAWGPANDPQEIPGLQAQLVEAGLVSAANVRPGVWDGTMVDAYKHVLATANTYGASWQDTLNMLVSNNGANGQSGIPKAAFPVTNPATISAEVNTVNGANTAQNMLGHNLSAADTMDFTKYYQGQETAARKQYMAADMAGPGNFYTQAPSLSASAQEYIKSKHLNDAVAYGTAQRALQFFSMLHGAGGTSANLG